MAAIKLVIFDKKWKATFGPAVEAKMLTRLGQKYAYADNVPNPAFDPELPKSPENPKTIPNPVSKDDYVAKAILNEILKNAKAREIEEVFKLAAATAQSDAAAEYDTVPIEVDA